MSDDVRSNAVYDFLCAGFNTSYVSESYRYNSARTHKHLKTDKKSNTFVKSHNINQFVKRLGKPKYTLKQQVDMYINWFKPSLNKQTKFVLASILA